MLNALGAFTHFVTSFLIAPLALSPIAEPTCLRVLPSWLIGFAGDGVVGGAPRIDGSSFLPIFEKSKFLAEVLPNKLPPVGLTPNVFLVAPIRALRAEDDLSLELIGITPSPGELLTSFGLGIPSEES